MALSETIRCDLRGRNAPRRTNRAGRNCVGRTDGYSKGVDAKSSPGNAIGITDSVSLRSVAFMAPSIPALLKEL